MVAVVVLGWGATRVIGPRFVPVGEPVSTPFQRRAFVAATVLLLVSADWPVHDIAEAHLYAVHMVQHMVITFIVPPLFLLAMPAWLTFAEGTVYKHYDDGFEAFGVTVASDQQAAGLIMKLLGGFYLWGMIIVKFIGYSRVHHQENQQMRPADGRHLRLRPDREPVE